MSSHHIVKEDQEPALIIEDLDGVSADQLGQLLEWSPTVIAHRDNGDAIAAQGMKVDVLFSDQPLTSFQDHTLILPLSSVFLHDALSYLISKNYPAASVVSRTIDPIWLLEYATDINVTLLGSGKRIFVAKSGFSKWKPKGESIYVYGDAPVVETDGLIPESSDHYLTEGDGFYTIWFEKKYGLVGELL